jgi:hypothetical protein
LCAAAAVVALAGGTTAGAAPPDPTNDGRGAEWRQLYETTGLSPGQIAQACPRDGATACSGAVGGRDLGGWVWATADQLVAFMGNYAPAILTASPPSVGGPEYFGIAAGFLADTRWTWYVSLYGAYHESTSGWTASTDELGQPVAGSVGYGWWPPSGGFTVAGAPDEPSSTRGAWLWRPAGQDHSAPAIASTVSGTAGQNGWYVSDVSVSWSVADAESPVLSQEGCDPSTVTADTAGTTLTCTATSAGGTGAGSTVVRRDTTPPTVTCPSPTPTFELYQIGAWVTAAVSDATSGPAGPPAQGVTNTSTAGTFTTQVTGADRAGNRTTTVCSYRVVVPTCNGQTATMVGTGANNVLDGTPGRDVIVGLGGADTINGNGGDDVICGGDGPDTIDGGAGNDWIDGGASQDTVRGGNGTDTCLAEKRSNCEL